MRSKKSHRDIRKENITLLQSKREADAKGCDTCGSSCKRLILLATLLGLLLISSFLYISSRQHVVVAPADLTGDSQREFVANASFSPVRVPVTEGVLGTVTPSNLGEAMELNGVQFIWENSPSSPPKGVVLLVHGCKHRPSDWFLNRPYCPGCSGLPMEVSVSQFLHNRGYALVAMRPYHNSNKSQCWHPNDKEHMASVVQYVYDKLGSSQARVPLFAVGIANGGIFLGNGMESLQITHKVTISAAVLMNCGIWHSNYKPNKYPAVLFVDTTRNSELCDYNSNTVEKMRSKGLTASQLASEPLSLYPEFFYDAMQLNLLGQPSPASSSKGSTNSLLTKEDSTKLFKAYLENGFLWPANHILLRDPSIERFIQEYRSIAQQALPGIVPSKDSMEWGVSPILQLLKVAWGSKHEISNEYAPQIVEWFESNAKRGEASALH